MGGVCTPGAIRLIVPLARCYWMGTEVSRNDPGNRDVTEPLSHVVAQMPSKVQSYWRPPHPPPYCPTKSHTPRVNHTASFTLVGCLPHSTVEHSISRNVCELLDQFHKAL
ncbi:hypothetical protein J6590_034922 [Homalodisca vitripennis]|nr:hypothetical protein J6590_034922 [Homalodisca vitripennis]